jgi:predicted permease
MAQVVFVKIAAMFLVIVVGWMARRRGFLAAEFTATLSRLVVDVAFPALVFTQLLRTVDAAVRALGVWTTSAPT